MIRRPPRSPLFPYPPLSRSLAADVRVWLGPMTDETFRCAKFIGRLTGGSVANRPGYDEPSASTAVAEVLAKAIIIRSEEHTSELQSPCNIVCRLLLEKKKND